MLSASALPESSSSKSRSRSRSISVESSSPSSRSRSISSSSASPLSRSNSRSSSKSRSNSSSPSSDASLTGTTGSDETTVASIAASASSLAPERVACISVACWMACSSPSDLISSSCRLNPVVSSVSLNTSINLSRISVRCGSLSMAVWRKLIACGNLP